MWVAEQEQKAVNFLFATTDLWVAIFSSQHTREEEIPESKACLIKCDNIWQTVQIFPTPFPSPLQRLGLG